MFTDHRFAEADPAAIASVLQDWKSRFPDMALLAMLPEAEKAGVAMLQAVCHTHTVPLLGAIFPALMDATGFRTTGVLLICLGTAPASFLLDELAQDGAARLQAGIETALQARATDAATSGTLFTVFDAMLPNIGTLLNDAHSALDAAPRYLGVNAGSETFQPMPCLFDNTRLVQNGVLGVYFPHALKAAVHHAYEGSISQWRATSATGNRIVTINGRPAFGVYQEIIRDEYGVQLTKENFYDYAVHFPFGLVTAMDILVRIPVGLGEDDSIVCVGEIAPDSMLRLLKAPALADSTCARNIGETLQANALATPATSLLTFYCAGRRMHFGAEAADEIGQIRGGTQATHLYGALSLGEIDTLDVLDYPRFHNAAVVCIAP